MTGIYSPTWAPRVRAVVQGAAVLLTIAALVSLTTSGDVQQASFALEFAVLLAAAALTRRFGMPLPGQGFSSLILADDLNMRLSRGRTEAVRAYLAQQGVPLSQMDSRGYGPDQPIAVAAGKAENRRVELKQLILMD